jgi:hypothetical protein
MPVAVIRQSTSTSSLSFGRSVSITVWLARTRRRKSPPMLNMMRGVFSGDGTAVCQPRSSASRR